MNIFKKSKNLTPVFLQRFRNRSDLRSFFLSFAISALYFLPVLASAQATIQSLLAWAWIPLYILILVIMALALIFFLWGMLVFILNAGSEEKRKEGKQRMIWGIIALSIIVGIGGIILLLQNTFLNTFGPIKDPFR